MNDPAEAANIDMTLQKKRQVVTVKRRLDPAGSIH
jgi:hypothetical protein